MRGIVVLREAKSLRTSRDGFGRELLLPD